MDGDAKASLSTDYAADQFHIGSNTKAMTATLIAILVDRERFAG